MERNLTHHVIREGHFKQRLELGKSSEASLNVVNCLFIESTGWDEGFMQV